MQPAKNSTQNSLGKAKKRVKRAILGARVLARAWLPQSTEEYRKIAHNAGLRAAQEVRKELKRTPKGTLDIFIRANFYNRSLSQRETNQQRIKDMEIWKKRGLINTFLMNRALDAVGVGYTAAERKKRREIIELYKRIIDVKKGKELTVEEEMPIMNQIFDRIGILRTAIFTRRFLLLVRKMRRVRREMSTLY